MNDPGEELYQAMIGLSEKRLDKVGLTVLFKKLAAPTQE
jgi:hypothetical protein